MTPRAHHPQGIVLYVAQTTAWICWRLGEHSGYSQVDWAMPLDPAAVLSGALATLQARLASVNVAPAAIVRGPWRLVLTGGFAACTVRPRGRWTHDLATAAAADLESVCPASFDSLQTAAIPIDPATAWACGLPQEVLRHWLVASKDQGLVLEGFWTVAGVLVDAILEQASLEKPVHWRDGRWCISCSKELSDTNSILPFPATSQGAPLRVFACHESESVSESLSRALHENWTGGSVPTAALPALAALQLFRIDPSESLNLLRGPLARPTHSWASHRPLAVGLFACAAALLVISLGNAVQFRRAQRQSESSRGQLASIWHQVQGPEALPSMPVAILQQRARAWQGTSAQTALFHTPLQVIERWDALVEALPADLPVVVQSLRIHGGEIVVEGHVASAANARRLQEVWSSLAGLQADPLRLSSGTGRVNFTARFISP